MASILSPIRSFFSTQPKVSDNGDGSEKKDFRSSEVFITIMSILDNLKSLDSISRDDILIYKEHHRYVNRLHANQTLKDIWDRITA